MKRTKEEEKHNDLYGICRRIRFPIDDHEIETINKPKEFGQSAFFRRALFVEVVFVGECEKSVINKLKKNHLKNNPDYDIIFVDRTTRPKR